MWARSLIVIAALGGSARAEFDASPPRDIEPVVVAPRLRIGQPGPKLTVDKVTVDIEQDALALTANVTLSVSTSDNAAREATIALEVPHGARVTGVALTIGKTQRMVALATGAQRAAMNYLRVLDDGKDPVLVQWRSANAAGDVIEVRAFPLTATMAARVELAIELPAAPALVVDTQARVVEIASITRKTYRKVAEPIVVELPPWRELDLGLTVPRPHVNATTSFYAGFPPDLQAPLVFIGGSGPRWCFSPDKAMIRRVIKWHMAQLQHCYDRAYQYNPNGGPDADAVLHFTIDPAGKVAETTVDGTIAEPAITSCLAEVIGGLTFPAGDAVTQVNYPLHFRLTR